MDDRAFSFVVVIDSAGMNSQEVAIVPVCEECGEPWLPGDPERWRAELPDEGPEDVLRFWCPSCWEREFA